MKKNIVLCLLIISIFGCAKMQHKKEIVTADNKWQEVLNVASGNTPEAKDKLLEFAKSTEPSGELARVILSHWVEGDNTFYLDKPLSVIDNIGFGDPPDNFKGIFNLKLTIEPDGSVKKVELVDPSSDNFQDYVKKAAMASWYCPAKPGKQYISAEIKEGKIID
jgi:hypothetical protein